MNFLFRFSSVVLVISFAGCRGEFVDFRAKVTLDGEPLEGAAVSLVGVDESRGRPCSGVTDADGVVRFTTLSPNDGVRPGHYKVVVIKSPGSVAEEMATYDRDNPEDMERILALERSGNVDYTPTLLPRAYLNPNTTPLSCEVSFENREAIFELDSSFGTNKR